jgi:hypothetical protein
LTRSLSDDAVEAPVRINPPRAMRGESPEEYQAELEELDLKLSVMVAEEPSVWSFDRLLSRAETMLDQAQTAIERGRARLLVNKIARFDEIKRRADAVGQVREHTDRRNQQLAHSSRQWDAVAHPPRPDDRYDGVGRLSRVKTPAAGGPRYALLSDDGSVACYVSPAPGVNLQAYEGQDVGVNGTRGYMPEQQAQHVVAKHITVVDDTYVR